MSTFFSQSRNTQVAIFAIFIISMMFNLGMTDYLIERSLTPNQFTAVLTKIIGIYSVHIAIMLGGFFNINKSEKAPDLERNEIYLSAIIVILCVCWNFMIGITIINYGTHLNTNYSEFMHRIDTISGAIYFLVAGGLSYFFGKRN